MRDDTRKILKKPIPKNAQITLFVPRILLRLTLAFAGDDRKGRRDSSVLMAMRDRERDGPVVK
jgi:hypothetical protein